MRYFDNSSINRLYFHTGLQSFAFNGGAVFLMSICSKPASRTQVGDFKLLLFARGLLPQRERACFAMIAFATQSMFN